MRALLEWGWEENSLKLLMELAVDERQAGMTVISDSQLEPDIAGKNNFSSE